MSCMGIQGRISNVILWNVTVKRNVQSATTYTSKTFRVKAKPNYMSEINSTPVSQLANGDVMTFSFTCVKHLT